MVATRRPSAPVAWQTPPETGPIDPQVLLEISRAVASTLELKPLLQLILEQLQRLVPYAGASVDLNEDGMLRQVAVRRPRGPRPTPTDTEFSFPLNVFDQMGIPLGEGSAQIIADVHGTSREAKQYRSLFGGDLKGTPVEYVRSFLGLPLIARDRIVGTLTMSHDEPGYFGPQHIEQLTPIASQAALAIDNARLFEHAQARTRELSALLDVSRALGSTLELRPLLEVILDQLRTVVPYDGAGISLIEGDCGRQIAARRPPGYPEMDPDEQRPVPLASFGMVWDLVRREQALIIDDIFDDSEVARSYRATWGADQPPVEYARSYAVVPLVIRDQVIGALAMAHHDPGYFKQEHIEVVRALAGQAAGAIENARLYEETQRRARQTAALLEVSRAVASTLDTRALMGVILDQLNTIVDHTGSAILTLVDGELEIVDARAVGSEREIGIRIPLEPPTALWNAINSGEAVIIDDVRSDEPMARDYRTIITSAGLWDLPPFQVMRAWMSVPLVHRDQVIGMLTISQAVPAYFKPEHARLARAFADQAAIAMANSRLFAETQLRAKENEALFRADAELFRSLDLDAVLQALVDVTVNIIGADTSMVATWSATESLRLRTAPHQPPERVAEVAAVLESLRSQRERALSAGVIVMEGIESAHPLLQPVWEREGIEAVIEVPIMSSMGVLLGAFTVTYMTPHTFSPEERRLLMALAERAAVAIQNAELYERAQLAASLEERQRLARELHDSVSQALYGIALGARTARTLLDRNPADAVEPLDYISSLAEAGLTEMRALIFELRPESLETEGLVAAITKQAAALQARHGLAIECRLDTEPQLPLPVKETLYRITQQALHNTVKHAKATIASVVLDVRDDGTTVTIQDNGAGFDPEEDFPGHLGLRSMKERAVKSGGTVSIESMPGSGTLVRASFPR